MNCNCHNMGYNAALLKDGPIYTKDWITGEEIVVYPTDEMQTILNQPQTPVIIKKEAKSIETWIKAGVILSATALFFGVLRSGKLG